MTAKRVPAAEVIHSVPFSILSWGLWLALCALSPRHDLRAVLRYNVPSILMSKYAGVSRWQVRNVWAAADLKPHCLKTFKISNDPQFAKTVVDVVGLYNQDGPFTQDVLDT